MNVTARGVVITSLILCALMLLLPPWERAGEFIGYRPFFLSSYMPSREETERDKVRTGFDFAGIPAVLNVAWRILAIQLVALVACSIGTLVMVRRRAHPGYVSVKEIDDESDTGQPVKRRTGMSRRLISVHYILGTLLVIELLVPPWIRTFQTPGISPVRTPAGYSFIFSPPQTRTVREGVAIDFQRLGVQTIALCVIVLVVLSSTRR